MVLVSLYPLQAIHLSSMFCLLLGAFWLCTHGDVNPFRLVVDHFLVPTLTNRGFCFLFHSLKTYSVFVPPRLFTIHRNNWDITFEFPRPKSFPQMPPSKTKWECGTLLQSKSVLDSCPLRISPTEPSLLTLQTPPWGLSSTHTELHLQLSLRLPT